MRESDRPTPPDDLEPHLYAVLEALGEQDVETIQTVADYVDDLAAYAESSIDHESEPPADGEIPYPADVPEQATATITEVDDNEYYYFQWRDGDKIRSKTVRR